LVYGVDVNGEFTAVDVRDAILRCFEEAHDKALRGSTEGQNFKSEEEFEKMKKLDVRMFIQKIFKEVGGDFDNPDKESLSAVVSGLEEYSRHFRKPEVIEKHACEVAKLINKLS